MDISLSFKATTKHLYISVHFNFELRYSQALQSVTGSCAVHRLHPLSWGLKTLTLLVCGFHRIAQLLENISSVVHCMIIILKTRIFGIIYRNFQTGTFER